MKYVVFLLLLGGCDFVILKMETTNTTKEVRLTAMEMEK